MIRPDQESQLVGQGVCFIHTHPKEPLELQDLFQLMKIAPQVEVVGDESIALNNTYIAVDTTLGGVTLTFPPTTDGREFHVTKMTDGGFIKIIPTLPDKILGSDTGLIVYNKYTSLHLKSVPEGYILI